MPEIHLVKSPVPPRRYGSVGGHGRAPIRYEDDLEEARQEPGVGFRAIEAENKAKAVSAQTAIGKRLLTAVPEQLWRIHVRPMSEDIHEDAPHAVWVMFERYLDEQEVRDRFARRKLIAERIRQGRLANGSETGSDGSSAPADASNAPSPRNGETAAQKARRAAARS